MEGTVLGLVPKEVFQLFTGYTQDVRSELTLFKLYDPIRYKKRLKEQLKWQNKVREEIPLRHYGDKADLGDVDPSSKIFYNVDWQLVYRTVIDFVNNNNLALRIPTDEPDYIKVFELFGFRYRDINYLLLRRAIENGFDKVLGYIFRPLSMEERLNESKLKGLLFTFQKEYKRYSSTIRVVVAALDKQNYTEAEKYIARIDQNSIAFSIILAVQKKFYSTIRLLSLQDSCYSTLLYVYDKEFLIEYYKRYYNLNVRDESLYTLVVITAHISTIEWYLDNYKHGVFPKENVREYLVNSLEYTVIIGAKEPATRYSTVEYLWGRDRYLLYAYLVLNGAPITEKNYLSLAIKKWGYDALKVVDSKRFVDIMTYERPARTFINAAYYRYLSDRNQKEMLYMIDYMMLADTRERRNESYAYNSLYQRLKIIDENVAKYLKGRL